MDSYLEIFGIKILEKNYYYEKGGCNRYFLFSEIYVLRDNRTKEEEGVYQIRAT